MKIKNKKSSYIYFAIGAVLTIALTVQSNAAGFFNLGGFFQGPTLTFSNSPLTLVANICSTAVTIVNNVGGKARKPPVLTTINITGDASLTFYSDPTCTTTTTTTSIAANSTNSTVFYVKASSAAGAQKITVTAAVNGYHPVTQTETAVVNNFIWTGLANDNIWSTGGNWSGGVAPGLNDVATFDGTCSSFCSPNITTLVSVGGVLINSPYAGTITHNSILALTVGARGWQQDSGSFNGSSTGYAETINGPFNLTNGTFKATSGLLTSSGTLWNVSASSTFTHNSGTISFTGSTTITPGTGVYNGLTFGGSNLTVTINGTITQAGTLTLANTSTGTPKLTGGQINLSGNLIITNNGKGGTTVINMVGLTNQIIDASAATLGKIPSLTITSSATVTFLGTPYIYGNYTWVSGTIIPPATMMFDSSSVTTYTPGAFSYTNITMLGSGNSSIHTVVGTWTITGNLSLSNTNSFNASLNGGTINLSGNLIATDYGFAGSTNIVLMGLSNQSIDCSGIIWPTPNNIELPKLTIASTGGTVSLIGTLNTDSFTYTSGIVNAGTSKLAIGNSGSGNPSFTPGGNAVLYNDIEILTRNGATYAANILNGLYTSGNVTLGSGSTNVINMPNGPHYPFVVGGTFTVRANATVNLRAPSTYTYGSLVNLGTINP